MTGRAAIAFAAAMMILSSQAHGKKPHLANPETLVCPKTSADLDYAIYTAMKSARFEDDPFGGHQTFRRDASRGVEGLTNPRWLRVRFLSFPTSEGTRLVAELSYYSATKVEDVQDAKVIAVFQGMLDQFQALTPCAS